jgi:hypothetical protein
MLFAVGNDGIEHRSEKSQFLSDKSRLEPTAFSMVASSCSISRLIISRRSPQIRQC